MTLKTVQASVALAMAASLGMLSATTTAADPERISVPVPDLGSCFGVWVPAWHESGGKIPEEEFDEPPGYIKEFGGFISSPNWLNPQFALLVEQDPDPQDNVFEYRLTGRLFHGAITCTGALADCADATKDAWLAWYEEAKRVIVEEGDPTEVPPPPGSQAECDEDHVVPAP